MKQQKYSKDFEAWYRNAKLPPLYDEELLRYCKHFAWKAWNAAASRLPKGLCCTRLLMGENS